MMDKQLTPALSLCAKNNDLASEVNHPSENLRVQSTHSTTRFVKVTASGITNQHGCATGPAGFIITMTLEWRHMGGR
jgi:hypothetical protein